MLDVIPKVETLEAIQTEVIKARIKFPGNRFILTALIEEVGELCGAALAGESEKIYQKAVQVACMTIRMIEEGDASFRERPAGATFKLVALQEAIGEMARYFLQREPERAKKLASLIGGQCLLIQQKGDSTYDNVTDAESLA